jgi:hypothetical protein
LFLYVQYVFDNFYKIFLEIACPLVFYFYQNNNFYSCTHCKPPL